MLYRVYNSGEIPPLEQTLSGLRIGLLLAVLVIFLLLSANFQSVRLALAIVLTIPAVLCGVLLMLLITGTTLNVQSFMGAIMAVGIATTIEQMDTDPGAAVLSYLEYMHRIAGRIKRQQNCRAKSWRQKEHEAARMDGAGNWRVYWSLLLPLSKPALTAVAIFSVIYNWNDFLGPLIYLQSPEHFTLTLGLAQLQSQYFTHTELIMVGSVLTVLPCIVLFFVCQRWFIQGIVITGVKG